MMPQQTDFPVDWMDVQAATAALRRAAALARKTAIDTNTHLVVMRNGKLVHVPAQQGAAVFSPHTAR